MGEVTEFPLVRVEIDDDMLHPLIEVVCAALVAEIEAKVAIMTERLETQRGFVRQIRGVTVTIAPALLDLAGNRSSYEVTFIEAGPPAA